MMIVFVVLAVVLIVVAYMLAEHVTTKRWTDAVAYAASRVDAWDTKDRTALTAIRVQAGMDALLFVRDHLSNAERAEKQAGLAALEQIVG